MKTINAVSYIADAVGGNLRKLVRHKTGVKKGGDSEDIHQLRVSARRLRTGLSIFKKYFPGKYRVIWKKRLRKTTRCLGQARDLDIHIASLRTFQARAENITVIRGMDTLIALLEQQRRQLQPGVAAAIAGLDASGVIPGMERELKSLRRRPRPQSLKKLRKNAAKKISAKIAAVMAHESASRVSSAARELHAVRIAAKELRYTLEYFRFLYGKQLEPFIDTARRIQDVLGVVHDFDVWILEILPGFASAGEKDKILRKAVISFKSDCVRRRGKEYRSFAAFRRRLLGEKTWEKLLTIVG